MNKTKDIIENLNSDNTEEIVKLELNNIYDVLSNKYNFQNHYGILSDIKQLISKLTLSQNNKQ